MSIGGFGRLRVGLRQINHGFSRMNPDQIDLNPRLGQVRGVIDRAFLLRRVFAGIVE